MTRGLHILGYVVGAVLVLTTLTRVQAWASEARLWTEAVERSPLKPRAWINLGREDALAGDLDSADVAFRRAVDLADRPGRGQDEQAFGVAYGLANLGIVAADRGDVNPRKLLEPGMARYPHSAALYQVGIWLQGH